MQPNIIERVWRQDKMVNVDVLNGFVFTGEVGAHKFVISGKNVNTPVDISGTITANFKNADGVLVPLTGTIEDGKAVVVLSRECYAVEGPFSLMIFADTVCIYAAIANAINSSGEVIAYPTATIPSVQELIEEVQDVIASIPQDYSALSQNVTDLKSASDEVLEILEHPISYSKSDVPMSAYFTTIIDGVQLIAGTRYDISATLASAATQVYYLFLYKGETSVKSITIASGSTTGTFYYDVAETGNDYSVRVASGAYAAHVGVSATVVPRTNGNIFDRIIPVEPYTVHSGESILAGVVAATTAGATKIIVEPGNYDIIDEYEDKYGSTYFSSYTNNYNNLVNGYYDRGIWLNNMEIVFQPGSKVVANYTGDNANVIHDFSAFAIGENVTVDGLVLETTNIRYGIHADFQRSSYGEIVIKNCDLTHTRSDHNQAIGAGFGLHSFWRFSNIVFHSDGKKPVFRIHNNESASAESTALIEHCRIDGDGYFVFNSYGQSVLMSKINVVGCAWNTPPQVSRESTATVDNIELTEWDNEFDSGKAVIKDDITVGVLNAVFGGGGTTLAENVDSLVYYFKVKQGSIYTINRGEPLRNSRVGYCETIPYIGCTITGYAGLYGDSIKSFEATADGYCCVLMRWAGDTVTVQQVLDTAYIYSGAYDPNVGKNTQHLDDISYIDKHDDSFIVSSNLFDGLYVAEKYLTNAGVEGSSANYGYTKNMIPVYSGYRLTANSGNGSRMIRYVTAYDKNGNVLADKGYSGELYTGYIVPDEVYYVRISTVMTALTAEDFRINNSGTPVDYDAYSVKPNNIGDMTRLNREPLTVLPDYFVNTMSYRPVGSLSKGYICMVTDDGTSGLATYTIPLAISKNVPFTFGVMHDSEVFADETMTATVVDAVNNHGCSVAQHGSVLWDVMSEKDLVNFFNAEKAFLARLGLTAEGAIVPQHRTNNLVKAVAGGLYGVVRSGYDGKGEGTSGDIDNYSITNYYDYYSSGERSNIYGLSSYNCAFATKAYNHSAIDYAYANNKVLIVYYHEFDIGDEQKEVIEDMIDYAKDKGITFTTLGNIRYIK